MNDHFWTCEAMRVYGGSFVRALGVALLAADDVNAEKIRRTWPEYWSQYFKMGQLLKSFDDAKEERMTMRHA